MSMTNASATPAGEESLPVEKTVAAALPTHDSNPNDPVVPQVVPLPKRIRGDFRDGRALPPILNQNGEVHKVLWGSSYYELAETDRQIINSVKLQQDYFRDLWRECAQRPDFTIHSMSADVADQIFVDTRNVPIRYSHFELALLPFCLARELRLWQWATHFVRRARQQYSENSAVYDRIFKELIPAEWRTEVRAQAAQRAYVDGTNANALGDFEAYRTLSRSADDKGLIGLPTGLPTLDRETGGLRGLVFLGGKPQAGKTSLALHMAIAALERTPGLGVALFSFEVDRTTILDRLRCHLSGLDYRTLRSGQLSAEEQERLTRADQRLRTEILPRFRIIESQNVRQRPISPKTKRKESLIDFMSRAIDELKRSGKFNQVLIVIDHLGKLNAGKKDAPELIVDHSRLELLLMLRERTKSVNNPDGFPLLVIAEIRKGAEGDALGLGDLRGSAKIGYSANGVFMLEFDKDGRVTSTSVPRKLRVEKIQDGGEKTEIPLNFHYRIYQFTERTLAASGTEHRNQKTSNSKPVAASGDPYAGH
jgi:replicative DNA helicase